MTESERRQLLFLMRKDPVLSVAIDELVLSAKRRAAVRRQELTGTPGLLASFPFSPAVAAEAIYKIGLFLNRTECERPSHYKALDRWMRRRRLPEGGGYGQ